MMADTTDEALVEELARAALEAALWPGAWDKASEPERNHYRPMARAILPIIHRITIYHDGREVVTEPAET
jgi:hypothetical protein